MPTFQEIIRECSSMLGGRAIDGGMSLRMRCPLFSAFIGDDAIANKSYIERAYRDCWGSAVDRLAFVDNGDYSIGNITEKFSEMLGQSSEFFAARNHIILAWYWDIMNCEFDSIIEQICNVSNAFPSGIDVGEFFFVFCKQFTEKDRSVTSERLHKLIEWADKHGKTLIVQSNVTYDGMYTSSNSWKCYRGAANCAVIVNTVSENQLGVNLEYLLKNSQSHVWAIGNHTMNKNNDEIVVASFQRILKEYTSRDVNAGYAGIFDVRSRLVGNNGSYSDFFNSLIEKWQLLPPMPNCIGDLPYTVEMEAFLTSPYERKLFSRRSNQNEIDKRKRDAAVASIRDFWGLFKDTYYEAKLHALKKDENNENRMKNELVSVLSQRFNAAEMREYFEREADELNKINWQNANRLRSNDVDACTSLHNLACNELLNDIYELLAEMLSTSMKELAKSATSFDQVIQAVENSFEQIEVEDSIRFAYGNRVHDLLLQNPNVLYRIHPCASVEQLLQQIKAVFSELVANDQVFKYSLQQDIRFRVEASGGKLAANTVMQDFFNKDMSSTGALRLFRQDEGYNYCLMNNNDQMFDNNNITASVGTVFGIPGSDYIDRLYIYPVEPRQIIY